MFKVNSSGDRCHGNLACTVYCHTDSACLCNSCDEHIHAANSMSLPHEHVAGFTSCENAQSALTCKADAASLSVLCSVDLHSVNPLADHHFRVPATPLSNLAYAASGTYPEELPGFMLETENEIIARTAEEIDEDEADSWLLLEPDDNNNNQTKGGFTENQLDDSMSIVEYNSCTEYQCQDQNNQQQLYCAPQGDSASDCVVPVQSFEVKEQEGRRQNQQQQHHDVYFNREYEASKAAFISTPSSSQSVSTSFINAGFLPKATMSSISNSCTRYPMGTTEHVPNFSLLMPLQCTEMNREAKVLRYRQKRKARKFDKKIRYASRKAYAEARPRVKGRFARKTDMDFEVDEMFLPEDYGYGIVPSY